jgi:hypothetical protein
VRPEYGKPKIIIGRSETDPYIYSCLDRDHGHLQKSTFGWVPQTTTLEAFCYPAICTALQRTHTKFENQPNTHRRERSKIIDRIAKSESILRFDSFTLRQRITVRYTTARFVSASYRPLSDLGPFDRVSVIGSRSKNSRDQQKARVKEVTCYAGACCRERESSRSRNLRLLRQIMYSILATAQEIEPTSIVGYS